MTIAKVPFNAKPYTKNDYPDKFTTDNSYTDELINGIYFIDGSIRRRPGYTQFVDLGQRNQPIDGFHYSSRLDRLIVSCNANLYSINSTGTITNIGSTLLNRGSQTKFDEDGTNIYAVNGGNIVFTAGSTSSIITDTDAPANPTHVAWLDGYLLFNDPSNSGRFKWSDYSAPTSFSALNFATAEGRPDNLQALALKNREIYLFGTDTTEIWYNDGITPFARRNDVFLQFGAFAKYSVVFMRGSFFMFMDNKRDIVILDGYTPKIVSSPIRHILLNLSNLGLSGAIAQEVYIGTTSLYKIDFPNDKRTFVYDYEKDIWGEWAFYNTGSNDYSRFVGKDYISIPSWGFDLVGDYQDSRLYKIGHAYLNDNGNPIRMLRRTQVITHGTSLQKKCNKLLLRFRRGHGVTQTSFNSLDTDATPYAMIRWRDNNDINYSDWRRIDLGKDGKEEQLVMLTWMGQYVSRQYEISCSDDFPFILYDMEEDIQVLRR